MTTMEFTLRLAVAVILGVAIGIERQWRQRSAGLRTNTLVALGATIFVALAVKIAGDAPGRVTSYIVSGIGFLGAGVIMKDGTNVKGLNTAATLWCSAAVGCLTGFGLFAEAVITSTFIVASHLLLRPVGERVGRLPLSIANEGQVEYLFIIKCSQSIENHIRVLLMQSLGSDEKLMLRSLQSADNGSPENAVITATIISDGRNDLYMEKVAGRLTIEQKVTHVSWELQGYLNDL